MKLDMIYSVKKAKPSRYLTRYSDSSKLKVAFNPYIYYEKVKLKNFQESSRLEGIQVNYLQPEKTLEDILKKYQR